MPVILYATLRVLVSILAPPVFYSSTDLTSREVAPEIYNIQLMGRFAYDMDELWFETNGRQADELRRLTRAPSLASTHVHRRCCREKLKTD